MNSQQQLKRLRKQLLKYCPAQQEQIMIMDKKDLEELLNVVNPNWNNPNHNHNTNHTTNAHMNMNVNKNNTKSQQRKMMQVKILKYCPGMQNQLKDLNDNDIRQIYQGSLQKQKAQSKQNIINSTNFNNVNQMRRKLMEKLPTYRNQIKNMSEDQIRDLYRNFKEDAKNKKSMELGSGNNSRIEQRQLGNQNFFDQTKSQISSKKNFNFYQYDSAQNQFFPNNKPGIRKNRDQYQLNSLAAKRMFNSALSQIPKQTIQTSSNPHKDIQKPPKQLIKSQKAKHKCKITFYLNQSDFEQQKNNTEDPNKNMLVKIVAALSNAFNKKMWRKQKQNICQQKHKNNQEQINNNDKKEISEQKQPNIAENQYPSPQQNKKQNQERQEQKL